MRQLRLRASDPVPDGGLTLAGAALSRLDKSGYPYLSLSPVGFGAIDDFEAAIEMPDQPRLPKGGDDFLFPNGYWSGLGIRRPRSEPSNKSKSKPNEPSTAALAS